MDGEQKSLNTNIVSWGGNNPRNFVVNVEKKYE